MLKKYADLLKQVRTEHEMNALGRGKDEKVLIIDGLNAFIRVFQAVPIVNDDGEHIGGYIGFLRTLAATIRQFKPTRCVIVFDGKGGSTRRKGMYSGYKEGRSMSTKMNRFEDIGELTPEQELESMKMQLGKLGLYLQCLPVTLISIDNIEADDVIAYLTTEIFRPKGSEIIIASDDKDFLQLIDSKTSVWRPVEKKFYTPEDVLNRFGIPSHNFIHYKVFMGDASDNIKGINGIGAKTMQKKLNILLTETKYDVDDILEYCKQHVTEDKIYKKIVDNEHTIRLNWKLMSLENLDIALYFKRLIADIIEQPIPVLDSFNFRKQFMIDKAWTAIPDVNTWLQTSFSILSAHRN